MQPKLCYLLLIAVLLQFCLSARIVQRNAIKIDANNTSTESDERQTACEWAVKRISTTKKNTDDTSSNELTDEDIQKMKQELSKTLTQEQTEQFGQILSKFTKGTTTDQNVEGMIQLLIFAVAVRSHATETELRNLFKEPVKTIITTSTTTTEVSNTI